MNFKTERGYHLYSVSGSMEMPEAFAQKTEDGYTYRGNGYVLTTVIKKHESGVFSRKDKIENTSGKPMNIAALLSKFAFDGGEYEVYTQYSEWCHESVGAWSKLMTEIGASSCESRSNVANPPFVAIYNTQNGRGIAFHLLAKSTWQMKVKRNYTQNAHQKTVDVEMGISERGFNYLLGAGETLEMPEILYYEFKNKTDMDAFKLHRYFNSVKPAREMPLVYDTWLSRFDDISFDELSRQLEKAKMLGFEYFVIDAGWFGKPRVWFKTVGEWEEETEASMCGRMKEFADKVRENGLKFGLWFEIERASTASGVYNSHPELYIVEKGQAFVNFANPDACEFIYNKLVENIDRYGIEFIKFDHNATLSYDSSGRSFIDYFKGYYEFIHRINRERPQVYLENCASGGLRMSLASLDGFDSFWMSDNHSLNMQLEVFKNTLIRMPSRALETWLTISTLENFTPTYEGTPTEKILSSGNCDWTYVETVEPSFLEAVMFGGPIGMSCDLTKLSEGLCGLLKEKFDEFKSDKAFWADSECRILADTETMLVLQFNDSEFSEIKLFAFAKNATQSEITVYPAVRSGSRYLGGVELSSEEIEENGITLPVEWMNRITASYTSLKRI